jgi:hypothetical protein
MLENQIKKNQIGAKYAPKKTENSGAGQFGRLLAIADKTQASFQN